MPWELFYVETVRAFRHRPYEDIGSTKRGKVPVLKNGTCHILKTGNKLSTANIVLCDINAAFYT